ncbi:type VI secretion system-associated FHA domain protein [Methylobacterium platani]|uniref:FHA domain-containing protein n=2 Tax=Methylobacterium platani TaxID=427683 RepID=A0A179SJ98_9HYPH|nr:FHA domain-containing protein [Methylobacterium platani]KMO17926.1 hypothetical protein SQ03_11300 [Methylobacterium platani JCM 14648]OAS27817.1 hypothetical protein A5481_00380 [Methylobacterium platani]
MTLTLRVLQAPAGVPEIEARRLDPEGGPLSIGRGRDNDWVLPDPDRHVSKIHCRIESGADGFYLVDLSSNGVFFAAEARPVGRGNRRALDAGDSFRIGDYRIGIVREPQAVPPETGGPADGVPEGGIAPPGSISAILADTSAAREARAAQSLGGPASDWLAAVPGGAADAQVVQPYGWQAPPATALTDVPEAEVDAVSDFASRSEHVAPIHQALQFAPARTLLPPDWHLAEPAGVGSTGPAPSTPDWGEVWAALIEGTDLGGRVPGPGPCDRAALVRTGHLLRCLVDVLATVEAVQRETARDLGLAEAPKGIDSPGPDLPGSDLPGSDLPGSDLPDLLAELLAAGGADAGDRLVARLAGVARDARTFGLAVAGAADAVGAQIQPDAIEDAAREGTRLAAGPLLKAACWERYAAIHANLAGGEGAAAADVVLVPLRGIYARRT